MASTARRAAVPATQNNKHIVKEIDTDDLNLSNLQLGGGRPDDSEIGRLAAAESIRKQLYDLGDREDDEQDESVVLGDLDDVEGSPQAHSRRSHKNNNRREYGSGGSSSEDFDGNFYMELRGDRRPVDDRLYTKRASSDEELNEEDDLTIGTLSRTSASPTMSPRRPPVIVHHMRMPTTAATVNIISPTSAFDGLSQGLKKELERNFPSPTITTTASKVLDRSMLGGDGTRDTAKRVFGQPIGNVRNPEGSRRPVAVFSKEAPIKSSNVSASSRSAIQEPQQRPVSTIYSTNRPAAGPTPSAPNPSLASGKSTATTIRHRPIFNDENVRPSTTYTSSTPAAAPRAATNARPALLRESPNPPSPSCDYSQRIRDNNARQVGIREQDEEDDESFADDDGEVERLRLPDITGLTEGMLSPEKPRGHRPIKETVNVSLNDQARSRSTHDNEDQHRRISQLQSELNNHSARERDSKLQNDRNDPSSRSERDERIKESSANRLDMERLLAQIHLLEAQVIANSHLANDIGEIRSGLHRVEEKVGTMRDEVDYLARGSRTNVRSRMMRESGVQASDAGREEAERFRRSNLISPPTVQRRRESISSSSERTTVEDDDDDRTPRAARYGQKNTTKTGPSRQMDEVKAQEFRSPSPAPRQPYYQQQYYQQHQHQSIPVHTSSEDEERTLRANRIFESVKLPSAHLPRPILNPSHPLPKIPRCTSCGQTCVDAEQPRSAPAKMMRAERERDDEKSRADERMRRRERREAHDTRVRKAQRTELVERVQGLERQFEEHKLMYDQVSVAYGKMEIEAQRSATAAHLHLCIDGLEFEAVTIMKYREILSELDELSRSAPTFYGPIPAGARRGESVL